MTLCFYLLPVYSNLTVKAIHRYNYGWIMVAFLVLLLVVNIIDVIRTTIVAAKKKKALKKEAELKEAK